MGWILFLTYRYFILFPHICFPFSKYIKIPFGALSFNKFCESRMDFRVELRLREAFRICVYKTRRIAWRSAFALANHFTYLHPSSIHNKDWISSSSYMISTHSMTWKANTRALQAKKNQCRRRYKLEEKIPNKSCFHRLSSLSCLFVVDSLFFAIEVCNSYLLENAFLVRPVTNVKTKCVG